MRAIIKKDKMGLLALLFWALSFTLSKYYIAFSILTLIAGFIWIFKDIRLAKGYNE